MEFVCLVKCARLLIELLPNRHPGYRELDSETRKRMKAEGQELLDSISAVKADLATRYDAWFALSQEEKDRYREPSRSGSIKKPSSGRHHETTPTGSLRSSGKRSPENSLRRHPGHPVSYSNAPPSRPQDQDAGGITFIKPDRSDDGFDVRKILGYRKSAPEAKREVPKEIVYQPPSTFTSSPLDPFTHSHAKTSSLPRASVSPTSYNPSSSSSSSKPVLAYPALRPRLSHRMSVHQTQQGFAPSNNATARYYQTAKPTEYPTPRPLPTPMSMPVPEPSSIQVLEQAVQQLTLAPSKEANGSVSLFSADEPIRAHTEGGQPLRSLHVPSDLMASFLAMAEPNTDANLETCALLQGRLHRGAFTVSHLVFPAQTATPDSCTTMNEEQIMEFQEKADLITLGWIHTHPTQSCFLSSLDLHTHAGYQMMLPEAIAIVCAPRHEPSFGLFRLTDPTGLQTVIQVTIITTLRVHDRITDQKIMNPTLQCREPGLFHPHVSSDGKDLALYTDAIYGHVTLSSGLPLELVDLRP